MVTPSSYHHQSRSASVSPSFLPRPCFPPSFLREQKRHLSCSQNPLVLFPTFRELPAFSVFSVLQHPVFPLCWTVPSVWRGTEAPVLKVENPASQTLRLQLHISTPLPSQTFSNQRCARNLSPPRPSPVHTSPPQWQRPQQVAPSEVSNLCAVERHKLCVAFLRLSAAFSMVDRSPTWNVCSWLLWHHVFWPSLASFLFLGGGVGPSLSSRPLKVGILQHSELASFFSLRSEFQLIFASSSIASPLNVFTQTSDSTCPRQSTWSPTSTAQRVALSSSLSQEWPQPPACPLVFVSVPCFTTAARIQVTVITHLISRLGSTPILAPFHLVKDVKLEKIGGICI